MYEVESLVNIWIELWLSSSNFYSSCNVRGFLSMFEIFLNKIRKKVSLEQKSNLSLAYRVILRREPLKYRKISVYS